MKGHIGGVYLFLLIMAVVGCEEQPRGPVVPGQPPLPTRNYGKPAWGPTDWIVFGHTPYDALGQPVDSSGLWLIRPDGTAKRPFTLLREVGDFDLPDWSPDGRWLALEKDAQIYKITVTKDSLVQLTHDPLRKFHPNWSPDGEWIAFSAGAGDSRNFGIWVVRADGSEMQHIYCCSGRNPDWSPDGKKIVFPAWPAGSRKQKLMIMDVMGKNVRVVFDPTRFGFDYGVDHPSFAPDGKKVVFQTNNTETKDAQIWVVNVDGRKPRQLTSRGGLEPSWSPDGRKIVYVRFSYYRPEQPGNGKLWIMDADGKNKRQLTF